MQIITVWVLSFFIVSGDIRAGDTLSMVDNIASYEDCMTLGKQIASRYVENSNARGSQSFACSKVKKIAVR